jgi:hypothetical protein
MGIVRAAWRRCRLPLPGRRPLSLAAVACRCRAGGRRFLPLCARYAHTNAPYKIDLLWKTLRPRTRPGRARTVGIREQLGTVHVAEPEPRVARSSQVPGACALQRGGRPVCRRSDRA